MDFLRSSVHSRKCGFSNQKVWERSYRRQGNLMGVGLDEIAKLCGVSRSTVSRVINNDPRVRSETRKRVQSVIRAKNYRPNPVARSLAGGHSKVIGLVIPMGVGRLFTDPYFPQLIQGVSKACNARDYSIMLWIAEPEYERRTIGQIINNQLLDGVIVSSSLVDDPLLDALDESNLPFITIGRHPTNNQISYVDVDNLGSAREMVSYMLRLGYRRIGTIAGPQKMVAGIDRLKGYIAAHKFLSIPVDPDLIVESDFSEEGGYHAMQQLWQHRPDAVFAASDAMAIGSTKAIQEKGLRVPEDIAVVGFDDLPFASRSTPPLTTVRQPTGRVGAVAVDTLISMIEKTAIGPHRIILPTEMVIRNSCSLVSLQSKKEV